MASLSVTIISYNEASRIEACLKSVQQVADEIVVVDANSTDATVDICRRYGCRVTRRAFTGFGAQRQFVTSLTTHSYVLSVDADEVLSPELIDSILRLKKEGFAHRVYRMARLNFYCGRPVKHCGWYPDYQLRLFDKRYANWNLSGVGERVIFPGSFNPVIIPGDLLHHRCTTPEEYRAVQQRHASLEGAQIAISGRAVSPLTPLLRGASAFIGMYVGRRAILDGSIGLTISRQSFSAAFTAYAVARSLRRKGLATASSMQ